MKAILRAGLIAMSAGQCLLWSWMVQGADLGLQISGDAEVSDSGAAAQGDASAEASTGDEDNYQEDMKPGITYRKVEDNPSPLQEAARNRQSISIGATTKAPAIDPEEGQKKVYQVKDGDTLWDICDAHFSDPYQWPRVWSYNPGVTNPHWIYPGDMLWLSPPVSGMSTAAASPDDEPTPESRALSARRGDAILNRNRGFVDQEVLEQSGIVRGAQKEVMMLSQYDEAYVEFKKNKDVQVGDEYAAFRVLQDVESDEDPGTEVGKLVEILGAVRVISFDKDKRIARVVIDESLQPIERETLIGPVHRRFEMVPSKTNQKEMKANVVAHLDPTLLYSQYQIVFVDKGWEDGVQEGNRFFAIAKRDRLREADGKKDDHDSYPFEVIAELRVLEARPHTSTCIVVGATTALEDGADLEMVKGY